MGKLLQSVLVPLSSPLTQRKAKFTGIAFVDSIKLQVCHNFRILRHPVLDGIAERGYGSLRWLNYTLSSMMKVVF